MKSKEKENLRNAIRQISDYEDDIADILYESLNGNISYEHIRRLAGENAEEMRNIAFHGWLWKQ